MTKTNLVAEFFQHVRFNNLWLFSPKIAISTNLIEFIMRELNFLKYLCQLHRIILVFIFQIYLNLLWGNLTFWTILPMASYNISLPILSNPKLIMHSSPISHSNKSTVLPLYVRTNQNLDKNVNFWILPNIFWN